MSIVSGALLQRSLTGLSLTALLSLKAPPRVTFTLYVEQISAEY